MRYELWARNGSMSKNLMDVGTEVALIPEGSGHRFWECVGRLAIVAGR